jgi:hypothetical protein
MAQAAVDTQAHAVQTLPAEGKWQQVSNDIMSVTALGCAIYG